MASVKAAAAAEAKAEAVMTVSEAAVAAAEVAVAAMVVAETVLGEAAEATKVVAGQAETAAPSIRPPCRRHTRSTFGLRRMWNYRNRHTSAGCPYMRRSRHRKDPPHHCRCQCTRRHCLRERAQAMRSAGMPDPHHRSRRSTKSAPHWCSLRRT